MFISRTLWTTVLLACFVAVTYLLYEIAVKLSYPPRSTKITTNLESSIPIPAFTLCNNNMYNKSTFFKDPKAAVLTSMAIQALLAAGIDQASKEAMLASVGTTAGEAQSFLSKNHTTDNMTDAYIRSSHTKEASILQALDIKAGHVSFYDNITSQLTDMGHCYAYDNPHHVITGPGVSGGVMLWLHVHPEEYTFGDLDYYNEGFKVYSISLILP